MIGEFWIRNKDEETSIKDQIGSKSEETAEFHWKNLAVIFMIYHSTFIIFENVR